MQLIVDKLEKSFGVQEVFKDVSFMIAKGSIQRRQLYDRQRRKNRAGGS